MSRSHTVKPDRPAVAVMGTGNWGRNLVRVFSGLEDADLRWIVDPDPEALAAAKRVAKRAGAVRHIDETGYDFDAAAVCTPAKDHVEHVAALLETGRHVFVEKPAALTVKDALRLIGLAKNSARHLMVGHQLLYHPVFQRLEQLLSSGALGAIKTIVTERTGQVDMSREPGVIWSYGPHDAAMVLTLAGEAPEEINARGTAGIEGLPTEAHIDLEFKSGTKAAIHLRANDNNRIRRLTVKGEKKEAVFDDSKPGASLTVLSRNGNEADITSTIPKTEPLRAECEHFIDVVKENRIPRTGPEHLKQVTRLLEEAERLVVGYPNR